MRVAVRRVSAACHMHGHQSGGSIKRIFPFCASLSSKSSGPSSGPSVPSTPPSTATATATPPTATATATTTAATAKVASVSNDVSSASSIPVRNPTATTVNYHSTGIRASSSVDHASAMAAVGAVLRDNQRVYIHTAAATPRMLLRAMADLKGQVKNVEVVHMHIEVEPGQEAPHLDPSCEGSFRDNNLFVGACCRKAVQQRRADYTPIFFSEVPHLFRRGHMPLDVALVQVSPPDRHGWCSLGVSVDCSLAAVQTARHVIAQINPNMPRTHGDGLVHITSFDAAVHGNEPIIAHESEPPNASEATIGKYVASLIPDGATLQMGIGSIPNAVLAQLGGHKDLGIHSELFSDGVLPLVQSGVINGRLKKVHTSKLVTTFMVGSKKLYNFIDDNPQVNVLDVAYVNSPEVIARNPRVHAINSAIEVDLTGQVVADSIGTRIYSGVGGQMDFMRGAAMSDGGKPIIALPSVTSKGESRIAATLKPGGGVVTTRAHVHYVVTEFGIAELFGKPLRVRAERLASIAHPSHRPALFDYIRQNY